MLFNTTEWSSKNGSRSVADPALTCRAIVIPPLNGAGAVRESVCRRDKRASAKMRKGGILQLGKADSSRLKPVRNDKGEIEWLVTYAESQRWKRCATQKHGVRMARGARGNSAPPKPGAYLPGRRYFRPELRSTEQAGVYPPVSRW